MGKEVLCASIQQLREQFLTLDWTYHDFPVGSQSEKMFCWPGPLEEEILICVHQSGGRQELFHRHDFFYFNFTYQGEYDSISFKYDNRITIREGELYAGQPFAGHALCVHDDKETTIIGVLIQRETFFIRKNRPVHERAFRQCHTEGYRKTFFLSSQLCIHPTASGTGQIFFGDPSGTANGTCRYSVKGNKFTYRRSCFIAWLQQQQQFL